MRIQLKIALLFTVVTTITMVIITISIYYFASRNAFQDFQKRLQVRANLANRALKSAKSDSGNMALTSLASDVLERLPQQKEFILQVENGKVTGVPADLTAPEKFYKTALENGYATYQKNQKYYAGIFDVENGNKLVVVTAVNTYGQEYLNNLKRIKIFGLFIKILLVFSIGYFFSKRILEPVRRITREAKEISAHSLHRRLPEPKGKDELAELTNTFNNMLDRLETAFESQNNFVSNASHELSTPLTGIIGESEWALNRERTPEEYQASISTILQQAGRLKHITKSLLQLAQSGFDGSKQEMKPIRIDELILSAKETVDEINPENDIFLDYSLLPENHELLQVNGNESLLQLAISNILMNACKYSNNQRVNVAIGATDTKVVIAVQDRGIGIPPEELPYIFDPFYRASNTRTFKGYGIGLPLTRNILRIHGGSINVQSSQQNGTLIELAIPLMKN